MRTLVGVLITLCSVTAFAQTRLGWQQEASENPQGWTYRAYFDVGPALVGSVSCVPADAVTYDCAGTTYPPGVWTTAYVTAENMWGESLPSNVITFQIPLPVIPAAPKNLRIVQ